MFLLVFSNRLLIPTVPWESGWIIFPTRRRVPSREPSPPPMFPGWDEDSRWGLPLGEPTATPAPSPAPAPSLRACSAWPPPPPSLSRARLRKQPPLQMWWQGRRASRMQAPHLCSNCLGPSWTAFRWWATNWSQSKHHAPSLPLPAWVEPVK